MNNFHYNHTCENTAKVSTDYPWGFKLRTSQRYWIETRENKGQRFVYQTLNPKTGNWCKPKKSVYNSIVIMTTDDKDHVKYTTVSVLCTLKALEKFESTHSDNLTDFQATSVKAMIMARRKYESR